LPWHLKYWDTIDQLYWSPDLLGLTSIPKREWTVDGATVTIPSSHLQNGGSIYTRKGTARENAERMRRLEEPLNHIFDITFGIAPSQTIRRLFFSPLNFDGDGPVERLGREVAARYPEMAGGNVTQQDAFFVAHDALVGVELKLGSKTWPGQVLKYLALMLCEERLTGTRSHIGLLYVTPHRDGSAVLAQAGCSSDGNLPEDFFGIDPAVPKERAAGTLACRTRRLVRGCLKQVAGLPYQLVRVARGSPSPGRCGDRQRRGFGNPQAFDAGLCRRNRQPQRVFASVSFGLLLTE
jgi:hypothetical protein